MKHLVLSIFIGFSILSACGQITISKEENRAKTVRCCLKYDSIGYYSYSNCRFTEAMADYINALKCLDSLTSSTSVDSLYGIVYQHISDLLSECDKDEAAKDVCFQSLEYSLRAEDSTSIAQCYRKIGNLCYYLSETDVPDTLLYYMQKSLSFVHGEDPYYSAFYTALIGIYKNKNEINITNYLPTGMKGITLLPNDSFERLPYLNNYIALFYWMIGETVQAIDYAVQSASSDNIRQQIDALGILEKIYFETGDTTAAVKSLTQLDSLNVVLSEAKRKASGIEKQLRQYETEKELQIKNATTKKHIKVVIRAILIVFLSVMITWYAFYRMKIAIKREKKTPSFSEQWEAFEGTEIYKKITEKCSSKHDLTASNVSSSMICLSHSDWHELEKAYKRCFNDCVGKLIRQYPNLNEGESRYLMLSLLELSEVQKAALLGLSYQGCISRRNRVQNKTGMGNLHENFRNILKNITES